MVILLTGATGFIGRHLLQSLLAAGHDVICATRGAGKSAIAGNARLHHVHADFTTDFEPQIWLPRLAGVDAVINTVGILREHGRQTFESIHAAAPKALFAACASAGVRKVIQISALGADEAARSGYHRSKKSADDFLATLPLDWCILQPSIVYGPGGVSAQLFTMMASLPLTPVPGRGDQLIQPVHLDDLIRAVLAVLASDERCEQRIPLVGPEPLEFREILARLRKGMGLGKARIVPIPMSFMRIAARLGSLLPHAQLDTETLNMLVRGNVADPATTRWLLRHEPKPVEAFISQDATRATARTAKLQWLLPVLRVSIGLVWLVTAFLSFGIYPIADSYALLARVGVSDAMAPALLYGAATLDLLLGIATLANFKWRWLWLSQIALILGYTLIITLKLPEYWLHPYGPILKNLPMLAALWLLHELKAR